MRGSYCPHTGAIETFFAACLPDLETLSDLGIVVVMILSGECVMNKLKGKYLFTCIIFFVVFVVGHAVYSQQTDDSHKRLAIQFVDRVEPQLQQSQDPKARFSLLIYLTPAAMSAGRPADAKNYAEQLISAAKQATTPRIQPWRLAMAIHISNTVLGLVAVDEGDIDAAKDYLLASGTVDVGSPTLMSFGPNMLLAKRLIEKGERETVIKYFDLCSKFWKKENGRLGKWKNIVQSGGTPDFGTTTVNAIEGWRAAS